MADVTLSDGREITLDLSLLTVGEWRAMLSRDQAAEEEDAILERIAGLEAGSIVKLPYPDWRRLAMRFYQKAREPLSDPN